MDQTQIQELKKMLEEEGPTSTITSPIKADLTVSRLKKVLADVDGRVEMWAEVKLDSRVVRHSRLSLHDGRVLLHALQDDCKPSSQAVVLPYDRLRALASEIQPTTFLQLSWGESSGGLVVISVEPSLRGQQFILLCSGRDGPSYANSKLLGVARKGLPGERIMGGDYDGLGGHEIVEGAGAEYGKGRPAVAGVVGGEWGMGEVSQAALFLITTRDWPEESWYHAFGRVESGLRLVREASLLNDIATVMVESCGLILG